MGSEEEEDDAEEEEREEEEEEDGLGGAVAKGESPGNAKASK